MAQPLTAKLRRRNAKFGCGGAATVATNAKSFTG